MGIVYTLSLRFPYAPRNPRGETRFDGERQRVYTSAMQTQGRTRRFHRLPPAMLLAFLLWGAFGLLARASDPCNPPNVIPREVCDFDTFYGAPPRQVPSGWTAFVLAGDLTFMQDVDTFWGAPSLRMWSDGGTFTAGLYTRVSVTPGMGYRASVAWAAPNEPDTFGRRLGLDPTGGTDPTAPTVIWGPMHWGPGRILNREPPGPNIDVKARAEGPVMTVFFLVEHNRSTGSNYIFVDAIALYPDETAPLPTATPSPSPVPPTPTPVPPTRTPTPPPTSTPTETPEPTATPSPSPSPSATATPLPSPTPTASATPTPPPTATPVWTATPRPTPPTPPPAPGGPDLAFLAGIPVWGRLAFLWVALAVGFNGLLWVFRRLQGEGAAGGTEGPEKRA